MRSQPSQRRYWRWFGVLVALVMLVAVPAVLAAHHYQQGVAGECALRFEADKTAVGRRPAPLGLVAARLGVRIRTG
jgi:hypothetical protein